MKKANVAILGAGNIARAMAETIHGMKGVTCYAVASRELKRAKEFAESNGVRKAYGSYEEMLKDEKVDLVYVATPHSHHFEHAKLCVDYGKPVLCEKAFTADAKQAEELIRYAEAKKVFVTEAIWTRYMPFLDTIRDVLKSGIIGEPQCLYANLSYPIEGVPRLMEKELAGGSLLDLGVYTLHFAGMIFTDQVEKISAISTYTDTGVDAQDSITLIYRGNKMAVLNCSMCCQGDRKGIIHGTKGYAVIDNINNFEKITTYNGAGKKTASHKRPKQITGYEYEVAASLKAVRRGWLEAPEIPHAETLRIMKLMDTIRAQLGVRYPSDHISV